MVNLACSLLSSTYLITRTPRISHSHKPTSCLRSNVVSLQPLLALSNGEEAQNVQFGEETRKFRWDEVGHKAAGPQKEAISRLPPKMPKRCKAVMRQIICLSEEGILPDILSGWVCIMKPSRADWLAVLKELKTMDHPLHLQVAKLALEEDSFEANVRDYTKIIHILGKQNRISEAESTLSAMKRQGFCDQIALTAMIDMYSKAGHFNLAYETFQEIKSLGIPIDKRSYGSMVMAYIREGSLEKGETLLQEMDNNEIFAGSEVYKALLRSYSMSGNFEAAQRIFNAIQLAGIVPDARICALLINAYADAGHSERARVAFENMRRVGIEPNDKCVSLVLGAFEKDDKLNTALEFLMGLEKDGIMIGKEASERLAGWFRRLGVVKEVDLVLRECLSGEEETIDNQAAFPSP